MADRPQTEWSSNLFDCFEDANTCCYGSWCGPCLACTVSGRLGEAYCLPLCDYCGVGVLALSGAPVAPPPAVLAMRAAMRNRYNIKGSLLKDIVASCFCSWCAWCQMHRELKERNKPGPTVININSQTVLNTQPLPTMMTMMGNPTPVMHCNQATVMMPSNSY